MAEAEQREIVETLFGRTREEIRDAIKLEEERRCQTFAISETTIGNESGRSRD